MLIVSFNPSEEHLIFVHSNKTSHSVYLVRNKVVGRFNKVYDA